MLRRLSLCALFCLTSVAACGGDDHGSGAGTGSGGSGGTGGSGGSGGGGGSGGSGATGGSGGSGGGAAGAAGSAECDSSGEGTSSVAVTGLPGGVDASVLVEGESDEQTFTEDDTWDTSSGPYQVSAEPVSDDDPIARTVYDPTDIAESSFCLEADGEHEVGVAYEANPSSNKLWTTNSNGDHALAAFASASLEESGDPPASITVDSPAGDDIAFDRDGNLWSMGPTTVDPLLVRYSARSLEDSGDVERDRGIDVLEIPCLKALRAMAFDRSGNLWLSTCGDRLVRLTPEDLAESGEVTPELSIDGVTDNQDLAFDADGNLWVVSDGNLVRFDAERLTDSTSDPADRTLTVTGPGGSSEFTASDLAFDAEGDLWVTDFGANVVFGVSQGDLSGSGDDTVEAVVQLTLPVSALLSRPAFDESGGLWLGLGGGGVGRIAPEQLTVSTDAGDPTRPEVLITSADLGSVERIAFFPAASDLPLYHALP